MFQVTQIVRFLLEGGLRFRNLQVGFCGLGHDSDLMETATFIECTSLRIFTCIDLLQHLPGGTRLFPAIS